MVQITNGTVKYGRTIKTGDFENKRGDVELSFNIPEGTEVNEAINHVMCVAQDHLKVLLHDTNGGGLPAGSSKPPARGKKLPAAAAPVPATDGAAKPESTGNTETAEERPPVTPTADEDLGDLLGDAEPAPAVAEITDKELMDATQKCQQAHKNAPAIRKALADLGVKTPGGRVIDLPQEKRQEYLDKLAAIKPLA